MKQLQLDLNKRLLIVEIPEGKSSEEVLSEYKGRCGDHWNFLCKGSDLTEDIAFDFVERTIEIKTGKSKYYNYKDVIQLPYFNTALESFISAIESKGYHWGENPEKKSYFNPEEFIQEEYEKYMEAEYRTFTPEKCIICEIL